MKDNKAVKFGKLIERLKRGKQLTKEELAFRCNIERKSMSNIETGKHVPSLESFIEIALNLDMNPSDLFTEIEKSEILEELRKRKNQSD